MKLKMTEEAVKFYQQEMQLADNDYLWLFVRIGGVGSGGFSAGVAHEKPDTAAVTQESHGLTLFITEADTWYFEGISIDYDKDIGDITFTHEDGEDLSFPNHYA